VPLADGSTPLITHVSSELGRYIAAFRPDAAIATTARAVYALLPSGGNDAALRLATGALPAMRTSFGDRIKSAVSFTSANPSELPAMRREVDDILRVTTRQEGLPAVAALKDVHTRVLLTRLEDELSREPRLRHPGVDAIVSFDQENRTDYAASVVAWLDAVGDMGKAASQLGVHPNTLRYRLRRVGELFDVSLEDADDRLSIWLQLRLAATPRTLDESTGQRRGPGYAGTPQHPSED
jgi:DNA-binding PucR family transcriptional regulator